MRRICLVAFTVVFLCGASAWAGDPPKPLDTPDAATRTAAAHHAPIVLLCGSADGAFVAKIATRRGAWPAVSFALVEPGSPAAQDATIETDAAVVADFEGEEVGRVTAKDDAHALDSLLEKAVRACKTKQGEIDRATKALAAGEKLMHAPPYARAWASLSAVAGLADRKGALGKAGQKARDDLDAIRAEVNQRASEAESAIGATNPAPAQKLIQALVNDCKGVPELESVAAKVKQDYGDATSG